MKEGQRNYWLEREVPLVETKGNQNLSRPKASVLILEVIHFINNGRPYTKGRYKVIELFNDNKIHFDGFNKI